MVGMNESEVTPRSLGFNETPDSLPDDAGGLINSPNLSREVRNPTFNDRSLGILEWIVFDPICIQFLDQIPS